MSKATEPWQTAEIAGPKKALVIPKPSVVSAMIKRAENPVLIAGHLASEVELVNGKPMDYVIRIAKTAGIPVVATAHTPREFLKRGFRVDTWMPAVDIANRLTDADWQGVNGKGHHDLALFVGLPYYMGWLILSGLKHFSSGLKTISLDMHYQPHASWSFPNLSIQDWESNLEIIVKDLGGE
ncbi:MAG: CO dehydrogenase/acetyl-CoA synthase complex subunit epsilon [Aigarchaeota archaeon]|nr:CO dehydrogenase/acetyl-CoA synthase complex subunit epsilon [Candidatus Bathyarchaeota archaeon]MDH5703079.1 CO dehydrogenase/acetyl-CoA synthase complex subunit epsilon [Aigarchaeota archaeon]